MPMTLADIDREIERLQEQRRRMTSPEEKEARDHERALLVGQAVLATAGLLRRLLEMSAFEKMLMAAAGASEDQDSDANRMWLFESALLDADGHKALVRTLQPHTDDDDPAAKSPARWPRF